MDLTLFIVLIIIMYLIYYLISSIRSLNIELKEVKNKCISTNEPLTINTPDPTINLNNKIVNSLDYLKNFFT